MVEFGRQKICCYYYYNDPIILKEFVNNKYTVLYDTNLGHDVIVETHDGVPRCKSCNADDCGHVGFTICVEQKYDNDGTIFDWLDYCNHKGSTYLWT